MKIYVVIKQGVYRHSLIGAFTHEQEAVDAAKIAACAEPDGYHEFPIFGLNLGDVNVEAPSGYGHPYNDTHLIVCTVKRVDKRHIEDNRIVVDGYELVVVSPEVKKS